VDKLDDAVSALAEAEALREWVDQPAECPFKVRG
jgi:hypothetical protein